MEMRKKPTYKNLTGIRGAYIKFLIWLGAEPPELSYSDTEDESSKQSLLVKDDQERGAIFEKPSERDGEDMPSEADDDKWISEAWADG